MTSRLSTKNYTTDKQHENLLAKQNLLMPKCYMLTSSAKLKLLH